MKEILINWTNIFTAWFLSSGIKIAFILVIAFLITRVTHRFITKIVRIAVVPGNYSSKDAEIKREDTLIQIFSTTIRIVIFTLLILMVLQELGIKIVPILAGAGIVGLAIGFGGQYLIRDIISGLFIILENQYRIGDVVTFDTTSGLVEEISLRMTTLRDLDGTVHHIPHGEIKRVSNLSKTFARVNLNVGVGYNSNLEHVIEVINRTGTELSEDAQWKEFIIRPPQFLRVNDLADSAIVIKILGETQPLKQWEVTGELRKRIIVAFNKEGIEIPFPQRVIHSK